MRRREFSAICVVLVLRNAKGGLGWDYFPITRIPFSVFRLPFSNQPRLSVPVFRVPDPAQTGDESQGWGKEGLGAKWTSRVGVLAPYLRSSRTPTSTGEDPYNCVFPNMCSQWSKLGPLAAKTRRRNRSSCGSEISICTEYGVLPSVIRVTPCN